MQWLHCFYDNLLQDYIHQNDYTALKLYIQV